MTDSGRQEPYLAIIAGGVGTRLWPRSRTALPKQLLSFGQGPSLIRKTYERVAPLTSPDRLLVVTGPEYAAAIAAQLPELDSDQILCEPSAKGTAPAITAAVGYAASKSTDPTVITVGSDHFIADDRAFRRCLRAAAGAARSLSGLLTIAVRPDHADTGMGYIHLGAVEAEFGGIAVHRTRSFVEKPDAATAAAYLAGGQHLWNCNYFAFTASALLAACELHAPHLAQVLRRLADARGASDFKARLADVWKNLPSEPIDTALMERADNVFTVPAEFAWADIGSWDGVYQVALQAPGAAGNFVVGNQRQRPEFLDSEGCLVDAESRLVAVIGLKDVVVVETEDAVLVCNRDRSQQVAALLARLRAGGRHDLL